MEQTIDSLMSREQKIAFLERSCHPLDKTFKFRMRGIDCMPDVYLDQLYQAYLNNSIVCRDTLNQLYAEKPELIIMIAHLSDERINRLFSSMEVIKYVARTESFSVGIAIIAGLLLAFGWYIHLLPLIVVALAIFFMDTIFIFKIHQKINLLLEEQDLMRIFMDDYPI